jgi:hypothetical protein
MIRPVNRPAASENVIESLKGNYVAITMSDGSTILFENSSDNYSTAALAPLQAYSGFTISPNPPSVCPKAASAANSSSSSAAVARRVPRAAPDAWPLGSG